MWNQDILAGYSLEERVQREFARRGSKEDGGGVVDVHNDVEIGSEGASPISGVEGHSSPEVAREDGVAVETTPVVVEAIASRTETPPPVKSQPEQPVTTPTPVAEVVEAQPVIVEEPTEDDVARPANTDAKEEIVADQSQNPRPSTVSLDGPAAKPIEAPIVRSEVQAIDLPETLTEDQPAEPIEAKQKDVEIPQEENATVEAISESPLPSQIEETIATPTPNRSSPVVTPPNLELVKEQTKASPELNIESRNEPQTKLPTSRPNLSSTSAHRSLSTLAEAPETEQGPTSSAAPTRKLTRGKAIRRSSSGLIKTLTPSSPSETITAPLFSAARFDFGKSIPSSSSSTSASIPKASEREFVHRASAPEIPTLRDGGNRYRRSEDHSLASGFKVLGGRRLGDPPVDPIKSKSTLKGIDTKERDEEEVIPPHREAALLRRESILAKYVRPSPIPIVASTFKPSTSASASASTSKPLPPDPIKSPKAKRERASFPSGPLIDFSDWDHNDDNDNDTQSNTSHHPEIPGLVAANAELLELLEQEAALPQSSVQAASTAQLVEDLRAQLQSIQEVDVQSELGGKSGSGSRSKDTTPPPLPPRTKPFNRSEGQSQEEGAIKKKPPPPPPPIRARKAWTSGQKISIAETATSPITPRPSIRRPPSDPRDGSPTRRQPPPLPTRRPPPPPPPPQPQTQTQSMGTNNRDSALPPPLFRSTSDMNSNTSSMFDGDGGTRASSQTSTIAPLPTKRPPVPPPWRGISKFDRSPQKPRGPRPAPPAPMRSWARVVSDRDRPPNDRTHSEEVLRLDTDHHGHENGDDDGMNGGQLRSATRSNSEMDLSRPAVGTRRRVPEYTDLDVFVSRLEGSGREYEVSPFLLSPDFQLSRAELTE